MHLSNHYDNDWIFNWYITRNFPYVPYTRASSSADYSLVRERKQVKNDETQQPPVTVMPGVLNIILFMPLYVYLDKPLFMWEGVTSNHNWESNESNAKEAIVDRDNHDSE